MVRVTDDGGGSIVWYNSKEEGRSPSERSKEQGCDMTGRKQYIKGGKLIYTEEIITIKAGKTIDSFSALTVHHGIVHVLNHDINHDIDHEIRRTL